MKVNTKVFDSVSKKEITSKSECYVWFGSAWVPLEEIPKEKLLSGNVWKFRFCAEDYNEEIYSLRLDWLQDELYIFANLEPLKK